MRPTGFGGCFASVKAPQGAFAAKTKRETSWAVSTKQEWGGCTGAPESSAFTLGSMSTNDIIHHRNHFLRATLGTAHRSST
jgi:hypothetical protein